MHQRARSNGPSRCVLAGKKGNDIEYFYASCTAGEVARGDCGSGIEGRHIHPMEPRSVRMSAQWTF